MLFILYVAVEPLVTLLSPTNFKITILNAASAIGRVIPNMLIYRFGAFNVMVPCVYMTSILIFCSLAIHNAAGTMVFAIFYGFFSGACECRLFLPSECQNLNVDSDASVLAPMVSSLAESDSEIGARMGVCFTFTGSFLLSVHIQMLTGASRYWRPCRYVFDTLIRDGTLSITVNGRYTHCWRPSHNIICMVAFNHICWTGCLLWGYLLQLD